MLTASLSPPRDDSFICPVLVGRDAQWAALEHALRRAAAGRGQTLLLAGEAGVGKSRLAAHARRRASQLGFRVVQGQCFEQDRQLPYAPLIDLLRGCFFSRPAAEIALELGGTAPELVKLLPELATSLPGLAPTPPLDDEREKRRLLQALEHFCMALSKAQPLLLVVEDLHWSDDASLEFLTQLARHLADQPLALLLTYRNDEAPAGLWRTLAALERERLTHELALQRLPSADVDALLRALLDQPQPPSAEFRDALYALTDGNPFFIEEVVKSLVAAGDLYRADGRWERKALAELRIPRSVQDAVQRRLERVSAAARQALELAAVAGRRFDFAVLQALTALDERALLALMRELIAAQLVVEESAERFAFRHALTRQAVYAGLLARERRSLHRDIAATLARLHANELEGRLSDLSYHYFAAEEWALAWEYARRAGERAAAQYAPQAAIEHLTRAIQAAERLGNAPPAAVYRVRGLAHETLGEFEQARADFAAALDGARAGAQRRDEWQALIDLGRLWAGRDYARAGDYYRQSYAVARALGDPAARAHSLNHVGNWHLRVEQPREARRRHAAALAIFERLEDRRGIAETLNLLGMACQVSGDPTPATAHYRQAVELFQELDDRHGRAFGLATLAICGAAYYTDLVTPAATTLPAAAVDGEAAVALARQIGWRAGEAYALVRLSCCLGAHGAYGRALEAARQGLALAEEIEHQQWITAANCALGTLYVDLLAPETARGFLERARTLGAALGSPYWFRVAAGELAVCHLLEGQPERAGAALEPALAPDTPIETLAQRRAWHAAAQLALARDDPRRALAIAERLLASAAAGGPAATGEVPRLALLRADALFAMGRADEARPLVRAALVTAEAQGARPLQWRLRLALGRLCLAEGDHAGAEAEQAAARAIVVALAATLPVNLARGAFQRRAFAKLAEHGRSRPPSAALAAKSRFGGLTVREREIAALIAQGHTNREIADELFASVRTVEAHVSNIFAKLDCNSRARVAAWAVSTGLTSAVS